MSEPITCVMFDLCYTLVHPGSIDEWIAEAWQQVHPGEDPRVALGDGYAETVAVVDNLWRTAKDVDPQSLRDLDAQVHKQTWDTLVAGRLPDEVSEALYPGAHNRWFAYDDAVPTLRRLRELGVHIGVLSNFPVGVDHILAANGFDVDVAISSADVGIVKPNPEIFQLLMDRLGGVAASTLMVGDTWYDDGGAASLGVRTLILPRTNGPIHGLATVADLVAASSR